MGQAEAVAPGAGTHRGVRREGVGFEAPGSVRGIETGAGVQHPKRIGQGGDGANAGASAGGSASLLQGDRGRQAGDLVDVRGVSLLNQATSVGRDRLEETALSFGEDGAESEAGLAGTAHSGERDYRVAGNVNVDVTKIVLARSPHAHEAAARVRGSNDGRALGVRASIKGLGFHAHGENQRLTPATTWLINIVRVAAMEPPATPKFVRTRDDRCAERAAGAHDLPSALGGTEARICAAPPPCTRRSAGADRALGR